MMTRAKMQALLSLQFQSTVSPNFELGQLQMNQSSCSPVMMNRVLVVGWPETNQTALRDFITVKSLFLYVSPSHLNSHARSSCIAAWKPESHHHLSRRRSRYILSLEHLYLPRPDNDIPSFLMRNCCILFQ
jgi:hypothetical protein